MNNLFLILVIGVVYWRLRNLYYNSLALEYQYKLFALRDKVRKYAIDKHIKKDDFFFEYMDSSICVTIKEMPYLNLIGSMFLYIRHGSEEKSKRVSLAIANKTAENKYTKELFDEYGKIIREYIWKKHYIIKFVARSIRKYSTMKKRVSKYNLTEAIQGIRTYPETSNVGMMFN